MMSRDLRSSDRLGGSLCRAVPEGALVLLTLLDATGWLRSAAILALPRRAALTLAAMPLADPASAQGGRRRRCDQAAANSWRSVTWQGAYTICL
jgi:hypothetical protein